MPPDHERLDQMRLYVDLKEHFEKLWDERKENITIQFNAIIDRLNATATVLEHRLEVLNHAHEQSLQDRADFAKKEDYDRLATDIADFRLEVVQHKLESSVFYDFRRDYDLWKKDEYATWKSYIDTELTTIKSRNVTIAAGMGIVFIIIQIVIALWKR